MPDEKANKSFHWINKLDQLDGIAGEAPVDHGAAWQRLHDRLQKKPVRHKATGYWIAAACLICMVLSWLVLVQPGTMLVKNTEPGQKTSPPSFRTLPSPDVAAVSTQQAARKKLSSPLPAKNEVHPALVHVAVKNQPVLSGPDTLKELFTRIVIHQPVDTIQLIAAAPKKKLRVVHVNELNNTVEDIHLASNTPASSAKELLRADDFSGFSVSRNASDNIVKIKLSSSN